MTAALLTPRYRRSVQVPPRPAARLLSDPDSELDYPDRRYRLHGLAADALREGTPRERLGRNFDPLVAEHLIPFYQAKDGCRTPADRDRLIGEWPGLFWADGIYNDPGPSRCRVEALLLGGASPEEAAGVLEADPAFLWWYSRIFFDVEGRGRGWLADRVMLPALRAGGEYLRENVVWKLVAGVCGWRVFAGGNDGVFGALSEEVERQLDAAFGQGLLMDALAAARTERMTRFNRKDLVERRHRGMEIDIKRKEAKGDGDDAKGDLPGILRVAAAGVVEAIGSFGDETFPADGPLAGLIGNFSERERLNAEHAVDQDAGRVRLSDET